MKERPRVVVAAMSATLLLICLMAQQPALADNYPSKPVKIIAAIPPGSANDVIARVVAQKLSERAGSQFYVENLPGAGGVIGTGTAARSPADGYTILVVNQDFVIQPLVKSKVPYDPFKSFVPIALAAIAPEIVVVNPAIPASSMRELVELLRTNPGKFSYASPGVGTSPHLASERLFKLSNRVDITHVPFQGGAPAVSSTVAGHTGILHITLPLVASHVKQGTLRALAIASGKRAPTFPDIPTLEESGFPNHEVGFWTGLVAPAGTPGEIVEYLNREIVQILSTVEVRERLAAIGFEAVGTTPEDFVKHIRAESELWGGIAGRAQIKVD